MLTLVFLCVAISTHFFPLLIYLVIEHAFRFRLNFVGQCIFKSSHCIQWCSVADVWLTIKWNEKHTWNKYFTATLLSRWTFFFYILVILSFPVFYLAWSLRRIYFVFAMTAFGVCDDHNDGETKTTTMMIKNSTLYTKKIYHDIRKMVHTKHTSFPSRLYLVVLCTQTLQPMSIQAVRRFFTLFSNRIFVFFSLSLSVYLFTFWATSWWADSSFIYLHIVHWHSRHLRFHFIGLVEFIKMN